MSELEQALRRIGRDDIVRGMQNKARGEPDYLKGSFEGDAWRQAAVGTPPKPYSQPLRTTGPESAAGQF